ncbi:flavin-containing monooxygenase [Cupriavidus plantarum]|uniref:4-hydroxyacetophenone monooxygenase n=1 Tax=Cupriavidus plantarum TaxID=942865 RepID=A0A316F2U0_9BURK|nr:NAD(P)/FAD-dependent oxidoreductase [Cupriavidus plantarum]PWK38572.1 4-hydroxyacetophenone monooxygenase [Cupriavidus plantarum]REE92218.1 4-hydroxyacetophenone monooxygenase [Cupriavidus plantarum]CAG2127122.1 4-hydroxyacetophenone monooxygenase [Cupriavidus plantarum]SMR67580.1 4-hydroxyacetophenone monooxygenase [Cupriavidus plantarum]
MTNTHSPHPAAPATDAIDPAWVGELDHALPSANVPTLLMMLLHLTGDRRWLSERYQCTHIRGIDDHDTGGLASEVQQEVRDAAREAVLAWKAGQPAALPLPELEELIEMMRRSVGEDVPDAYGPMVGAWLGGDPAFRIDQRDEYRVPEGFHVVVIGAGVAGLCASIRLQGAGIPHTVIEKNAEVGGTWYENRYPGAGVDTPNHIYSYSFAKADWTRYFALREEIQAYFVDVSHRFGVREHMRFVTKVDAATYNEGSMDWTVRVSDAEGNADVIRADVVISAVGLLNVPKMPSIPGLDTFDGPCFHSARWPEGLDVKSKRVAIIGNGASAMQIVPAIAPIVSQLTVFQRSKQWAAPFDRFQKPVPAAARFLLKELPYYQPWYRQRLAWIFNDRIHASLQVDPEWPHPERAINRRNDKHREFFVAYMRQELGERQDLLPDVLPDYPPFGKRMLMDNGWFRTATRENVCIVNDGIARVERDAVITTDGRRHEADVLVVCTGFDAVNLLSSFHLHGRGGRNVREHWDAQGAQAYLGVATPGFPNFFMLAGPNTALGHGGSVVALLETQVQYVMSLLKAALNAHEGRFEIEVRQDVHDAYNQRVQDAHARMIWTHKGMSNWYRNARGRVVAPTPFRNDDYWHMTRNSGLADYNVRDGSRVAQARDAQKEGAASCK